MAGEHLRDLAPPCGRQLHLGRHADNLGIIGIGQDQPAVIGQQINGKIRIHRPEETVAPLKIALPFAVLHEIGPA